MREALLESQRENLSSTLAEEQRNCANCSRRLLIYWRCRSRTRSAPRSHAVLGPLRGRPASDLGSQSPRKRNALSYEDMERMMAEGADPAQFQKPPYDPVPPPNPTRATARRPRPRRRAASAAVWASSTRRRAAAPRRRGRAAARGQNAVVATSRRKPRRRATARRPASP